MGWGGVGWEATASILLKHYDKTGRLNLGEHR